MYYRVHEALAEKIPIPDLVVYLRASTDTLMQRIALRDRPYERQMESSYIADLNQAYDALFQRFPAPDPGAGHRYQRLEFRLRAGPPQVGREPHPPGPEAAPFQPELPFPGLF